MMYRFLLAPVVLMLSLSSSLYVETEDPLSYDYTFNIENRLWKLEHEVKTQKREAASMEVFRKLFYEEQIATLRREFQSMAVIANDNRSLLRDGSPQRISVLQRLVQLEDQQKKMDQWQIDQKSASDQNRQLFWALGISVLGHFLAGTWMVAKWWTKDNTGSGTNTAANPS